MTHGQPGDCGQFPLPPIVEKRVSGGRPAHGCDHVWLLLLDDAGERAIFGSALPKASR
jgi:hypothetical protein